MSAVFGRLILISGVAFSLSGCAGESPVSTEETIAEDSALAAEVLSAKGDNLFAIGAESDDTIDEPVASESVAEREPPTTSQRAITSAVVPAPRQPAATVAVAASAPAVKKPRAAPAPQLRVNRGRSGVVSAGSELTLVSNQRACDDGGRSFRATVVNTVRGSGGVVIPRGSQATAEITGTDKWGAGITVRVKSVRIGGRSYPVASRVGYVLPDKDGCIRERGRIEIETTAPLRVVAMNTGN